MLKWIFAAMLITLAIYSFKNKRLLGKVIQFNQEVEIVENINLQACIKTDKGDINIKLFPQVTPVTVLNFVNLSKRGYYDGLKFHRVINDFMIQGGDPTGTGSGGPGYNFRDEFKEGVTFDKKGILAMANAGPNTNGSQFFITHVETPWLNYKHSIFGEVVSEDDQKIVDAITQGTKIETIVITGDVEEYIEKNKENLNQLNETLEKTFPDLPKYY
jgi:peptidyl-prolyl cis-trans isomerase B (cyclophilin B)